MLCLDWRGEAGHTFYTNILWQVSLRYVPASSFMRSRVWPEHTGQG
jgi:hypothetical protein